MTSSNKLFFLLLLPFFVILQGCGVYSFTGANVSPDVKTVSIPNFANQANQGPSNLSQIFSEQMRDYFQRNTNLTLVRTGGDLQFEGAIITYEVLPAAIQREDGQDIAALNRLTIRVQMRYTNNVQPEQNFDQSFSFFRDFPQEQSLQQVEGVLIEEISEQIIVDIFNKSVANW